MLAEQGRTRHSHRDGFTDGPPSGTNSALPVKLSADHSRRVGVECGKGLLRQDRTPADTLPTKEASSTHPHKNRRGKHADRDPEHARETGYQDKNKQRTSTPRCSWYPKRMAGRPEKAQPVSDDQELKDESIAHAQIPTKIRRLDGQDRPERCLFHDSHCTGGQRFPQIPMDGQDIPL